MKLKINLLMVAVKFGGIFGLFLKNKKTKIPTILAIIAYKIISDCIRLFPIS